MDLYQYLTYCVGTCSIRIHTFTFPILSVRVQILEPKGIIKYADTEPPCFTFALISSFTLSLVNIFSVISPLSELQNFFLVILQHFPSARTGQISYSADGNSQFEDLVKRQFFEFLKNGTYISLIMQFRSICRSRNGALHLRTNDSVGQFRLMENSFFGGGLFLGIRCIH